LGLNAVGLKHFCDVFQVDGLFSIAPASLDPINELKQQRIVILDRPLLRVSKKDVSLIVQNIAIFFE